MESVMIVRFDFKTLARHYCRLVGAWVGVRREGGWEGGCRGKGWGGKRELFTQIADLRVSHYVRMSCTG